MGACNMLRLLTRRVSGEMSYVCQVTL